MKPKIMISGPLPPPLGGMETYCQDYLNTDIPEKYDIIFCRCILIRSMPQAKGVWGLFLRCLNRILTMAIWLILLILKRPEIVHVHTNAGLGFYARGYMTLWALKFRAKAILHMHGAEFKEFYWGLSDSRKERTRRFLMANSFLIVLSKEWEQFFLSIGIPQEKIVVKTNSVFLPDLSSKRQPESKLTVLYLSRIEQRKGIYELIDAIQNYSELRENFRYIIAGPRTYAFSEIKSRVESLGFSEFIEIPGPLVGKAKDAAYRAADIYLLQSFAEGMPIGLLEAMSYGLTCITTPVGGIPDVIQDQKNGILIAPGDSEALAQTLRQLSENPALLSSIGLEARKTIEQRYNWIDRAKELEDLYQKLLA